MIFNGVYAITTSGISIFEQIYEKVDDTGYVTAEKTLNIIAIVDPLSQALAIFLVPLFTRKSLLLVSYFTVGLLNVMIAVMDGTDTNEGVFFVALAVTVVTSALQEPALGIYITEASSNATMGAISIMVQCVVLLYASLLP
jgi:hypothetical protein